MYYTYSPMVQLLLLCKDLTTYCISCLCVSISHCIHFHNFIKNLSQHITVTEDEDIMDTGNRTLESDVERISYSRNITPGSDLDEYIDAVVDAELDEIIAADFIEQLRWNPISQKWE
jgi:hypothetical protein